MQAARIDGQNLIFDDACSDPKPAPGDAVIRPTRLMVAPADVAVARGRIPFTGVLGRLFVGVVEQIAGDDKRGLLGKRVVGRSSVVSPDSELAKRGLPAHDPQRGVLGLRGRDGCFAERFTLPVANLAPVPDDMDDDRAIFASPTAAAVHAAQLVRLDTKTFVTVLGDSLQALLCAQVMAARNASVRLLGSDPERFGMCERWGVKHRHIDAVGRRQDQDVVVDCVAEAEGPSLATRLVRPRGTIILTGEPVPIPRSNATARVDPAAVVEHELTVIGSRSDSVADGLAELATSIDLAGLITKRLRFDQLIEAINLAATGDHIAVVIDCEHRTARARCA